MAEPAHRELLTLAIDLARQATEVHRAYRSLALQVETKSTDTDPVSDADREAERVVVERLLRARPDDGLIAEEGAGREGTSGVRWIIDPLDGTVNFVRGYPSFGCSIAVEIDGRAVLGVVSDSVLGGVYAAVVGERATYDGKPIASGPPSASLDRAIVSTGFSYEARQRHEQGQVIARIIDHIADIRRSGSAALDLCRVAAGQVDAFFELDLAPWDYAAGTVIARAAGAEVLHVPGAHGQGPAVVAAHPQLLPELVGLLRAAGALAD